MLRLLFPVVRTDALSLSVDTSALQKAVERKRWDGMGCATDGDCRRLWATRLGLLESVTDASRCTSMEKRKTSSGKSILHQY